MEKKGLKQKLYKIVPISLGLFIVGGIVAKNFSDFLDPNNYIYYINEDNKCDGNIFDGNELIIDKKEIDKRKENVFSFLKERNPELLEGLYKNIDFYDSKKVEKDLLLLDAIISNKSLNEDNKSDFCEYVYYFLDNDYNDYDNTYATLKRLDVVYKSDSNETVAHYEYSKNLIVINDDLTVDVVKSHEFFHSCDTKINICKYSRGLSEGLATERAIEYNDYTYSSLYVNQVCAVRCLSKIIDSDILMKFCATGDLSLVTEELYKINPDKDKTLEFLKFLSYSSSKDIYMKEIEEEELNDEKLSDNIVDYLDSLYKLKYNKCPDELYELYLNDIRNKTNEYVYVIDYVFNKIKKREYKEPFYIEKITYYEDNDRYTVYEEENNEMYKATCMNGIVFPRYFNGYQGVEAIRFKTKDPYKKTKQIFEEDSPKKALKIKTKN